MPISVNLHTSFLTPPFIAMQLTALVLLFVVPAIATWLPQAIGW